MSTYSFRRAAAFATGLLALGAAQACTPDACLRHSDCAPSFVCVAGACAPAPVDAGPHADASTLDAALADAGVVDAGPVDAGPIDAGVVDADTSDADTSDASTTDAGI